jgi:predicted branched-subunit amino acid permease
LGDVKRFGFDLFLPIFFGAMAVNLFEKRRDYLLWSIAAGVSLTAFYLIDGYWYIVIGAITAALVGGFYERSE